MPNLEADVVYAQADKDNLRRSYVFDGMPLDKCANLHGVSYPTAQRWRREAKELGDDWDKVKSAHSLAGGELEEVARQILTDFVIQFKTTMELVKNSADLDAKTRVELLTSLSDSYNKAISANRKLMPETSKLAVALSVIERLAEFIKDNKPELLESYLGVLEPFGQLIEKEFK